MNRIKEILDKSETLLEHMLERRKLQAGRIFTEKYRVWKYKFKNETDFFMQNKEDDKNNLVISCLNSSIITGKNAYQIAWYNEEIYVDPYPPCTYYAPEFLFYEIQRDIEEIKRFLNQNFIRVMDYEMEEVRRKYMKKIYFLGKDFMVSLIRENGKQNIKIWFGEYMKDVECIGEA